MRLAYAIVDAAPVTLPRGACGGELRAVGAGPYDPAAQPRRVALGSGDEVASAAYLIVEDVVRAPAATLEALRAHHRVVVAAAMNAACLPCRFAETFADDGAARAWLARREDELRRALAQVRGRCEFDLRRARGPDDGARSIPRAGEPNTGTRYLEALRDRYAARDAATLETVAADARRRLPQTLEAVVDSGAGTIAFLVATREAAAFATEARAWVPDAGWRWSGPWPPYSFAAAWLGGPS